MSLHETINICADALYGGNLDPASIPENLFLECMRLTTEGVEFSVNDIMYSQIDGVAMGSTLGPILAVIFVTFHEGFLLSSAF